MFTSIVTRVEGRTGLIRGNPRTRGFDQVRFRLVEKIRRGVGEILPTEPGNKSPPQNAGSRNMKKNEDRKLAEDAFLEERGRITNKELAARLNVHPATIARWRRLDDWDMKLVRAVSAPDEIAPDEEEPFLVDLRHIRLLNDRIDTYLNRKELLPSEIRELAEAKYHLMNCTEIIRDQMTFPFMEDYTENGSDFD
jgi:hypothetical protein